MAHGGRKVAIGLLALAGALAVSLGVMSAQAGPTDPKENCSTYAQRKAYYDSTLGRPSFRWRCRGIVTLGSGGDPEAVDILTARYTKAEAPTDHVRYAIANVFRQYYDSPSHAQKLVAFADTQILPGDAWLWYNMDTVYGNHVDYKRMHDIAVNEKNPWLRRAAAVYAMKDAGKDMLLSVITANLQDAKMPKSKRDHSLLLEAMSFALMSSGADKASEEFEIAFKLIGLHFDDKKTPDRTKYVMGRHFAKMFGIDDVYINFDGWRREHIGQQADARNSEKPPSGTRVPPPKGPSFMGIKGSGKHVAYLIDLSDSMLTKVTKPKAKPKPPEPPKGPITGGGKGKKKEEEEKKPEPTDEELLNWDKITNRFELAREYLKLSLDRLTPDMTFTVIVFGTDAENIKVTKGMVQATPAAIGQVKKFFDTFPVGSRSQMKPLGTLKGDTNIHGSFMRAFESNSKGVRPKQEYVDETSFLEGCDTIFLLSDGAPNVDDFVGTDNWEQGVRVVKDREAGGDTKSETVNYSGPYAFEGQWLVLDIKRMNLFRHAEIHTLGMGREANEGLLRAIADAGYGKCKMVGSFD